MTYARSHSTSESSTHRARPESNTRPRGYQSGLLPADGSSHDGNSPSHPSLEPLSRDVLLLNPMKSFLRTPATPLWPDLRSVLYSCSADVSIPDILGAWLESRTQGEAGAGAGRGRGRGLGSAELGDSPLSQQVEAAPCVLLRPANCLLGAPPRAQPWRQSVRPRVPRVPGGHPGPRAIVCPSSVCSEGSDSQIFQPRVQASSLLVSRVPFRQRCRCTQAVG